MKHLLPAAALLLSSLAFTPCAFAADDVKQDAKKDPRQTEMPGAVNSAPAAAPKNPKTEDVTVIFKQHYDIGFWGRTAKGPQRGSPAGMTCPITAAEIVETYKTFHLDQAIAAWENTKDQPPEKRFVWAVPGWVAKQMLDQPEPRHSKVVEMIKQGGICVHATPFTTYTEALELEDFTRGLGFASRIARDLKMPLPVAAKMTDVLEHTFALATILSRAGIRFLHTGANGTCTLAAVPPLFWWEGPDGSRILSMYNRDYGSSMIPPKNWPSKNWLWISCRGDNCGSQSAGDSLYSLNQASNAMKGARVHTGSMDGFTQALWAEKPNLEVVREDFGDTWIHGIMSMPAEVAISRHVRPHIASLEALDTLLCPWIGAKPAAAQTVAAAYEKSVLFGEHTWGSLLNYNNKKQWFYGADFDKAWDAGFYKAVEATYQEHGDYIRSAQSLVEPALATRMELLARAVDCAGKRVVVFNPLPWRRGAEVELAAALPAGKFMVRDASTKKLAVAESDGKTVRFHADDLPPQGYRTYAILEGKPVPAQEGVKVDAAAGVLENRFLRITLDKARGTIASIVDKRTGRELVDSSAKYGFGQYLYERFSNEEIQSYLHAYTSPYNPVNGKLFLPSGPQYPYVAASPKQFALTVSEDSQSASATLRAKAEGAISHETALKITLGRDASFVDLEWSITGKRPDLWPEAGWLCLPVKADKPTYRMARMLGVIDPSKDIRKRTNVDLFCLGGGMTVQGADRAGLGICPVDSPTVSLGGPGIMRYSTEWQPRDPVVLVNLFNNTWGCNFRQWIDGSWSSRVRVWPVSGQSDEANLITPSQETRNPCLAAMADGPAGTRPAEQAGVEVSRKGVTVTAFGADPDGVHAGTLLRVWEQAGTGGELTVSLPGAFTTAAPVNLRGEPAGEPLKITGNKLVFELGKYAPASFVLK